MSKAAESGMLRGRPFGGVTFQVIIHSHFLCCSWGTTMSANRNTTLVCLPVLVFHWTIFCRH